MKPLKYVLELFSTIFTVDIECWIQILFIWSKKDKYNTSGVHLVKEKKNRKRLGRAERVHLEHLLFHYSVATKRVAPGKTPANIMKKKKYQGFPTKCPFEFKITSQEPKYMTNLS